MKQSDLNPPCKDCADRHSLCHSDCERYRQYKSNRRSFNEWQRDYAIIEGVNATRSKRIAKDAKRRQDEKRRRKG